MVTTAVDTSALVSLFAGDAHTGRVDCALRHVSDQTAVSALTGLEFTSAVNQFCTSHKIFCIRCKELLADYGLWIAGNAVSLEISGPIFSESSAILAQLRFNLRGPDALHIAICHAFSAQFLTFDINMATGGRALGVDVIEA
jgi:predicted nucleic acid-binding protein